LIAAQNGIESLIKVIPEDEPENKDDKSKEESNKAMSGDQSIENETKKA